MDSPVERSMDMNGQGNKPDVPLREAVSTLRRSLEGELNLVRVKIAELKKEEIRLTDSLSLIRGLLPGHRSAVDAVQEPQKPVQISVPRGTDGRRVPQHVRGIVPWPLAARQVMHRGERVPTTVLFKRIMDAGIRNPGKRGVDSMMSSLSSCKYIKYDRLRKGWYLGRVVEGNGRDRAATGLTWAEAAIRVMGRDELVSSPELYRRIVERKLHAPSASKHRSMVNCLCNSKLVQADGRNGWYRTDNR